MLTECRSALLVDNTTGFEGKMQRLVDTAATLCGIPTTVKVDCARS